MNKSHDALPGLLLVSPAPFMHSGATYRGAMYTIIIALAPLAVFAIHRFGLHAARVMAIAISSAMITEWVVLRLRGRRDTVSDGNALLTGLLLAFLLPPSAPWWLVSTGSIAAIFIGKQIYGGKGCNPFCPALIGWAVIRLSWPLHVNFDFAMVQYNLPFAAEYPLSLLKKLGTSGIANISYRDLFFGNQVGGIGSVYIFLLLAGGLACVMRGVIHWIVPVFFILGTAATAALFHSMNSTVYADPIFHLLTGNVMFGAFFLATDYSSSPVNRVSMALFGLGCGIFTILFRAWSVYPDGVPFAILIMNILNPMLDKIGSGRMGANRP
jgi:electron transport complex protein RnfD